MDDVYDIESTFVGLGRDGETNLLEVTPSFWPDLVSGKLEVGPGRMVSGYSFDGPWDSWEVHPKGDELVVLIEGAAELRLERSDDRIDSVRVDRPGQFVFVPRGTWHTICALPTARMLFITDGEGTDHRPAE